jgi:hypothetical protein
MIRLPAGDVLTTSELASGQQYVLRGAVVVQFSDASAPLAATATRSPFIWKGKVVLLEGKRYVPHRGYLLELDRTLRWRSGQIQGG